MGRELKRVPIDFQWTIDELWCGYVNPHKVHKCKDCDGSGYSKDYEILADEWYGYNLGNYKPNPFRKDCIYNASAWQHNITKEDVKALLKAGRLWDFTRVPINDEQREIVNKKIADGGNSWLPFDNGYIPTPQEVNEWNLKGIGHDGINASTCIKARLKREKKDYLCSTCKGTGENWQHPKAKKLYKNWKSYEPPKGDGFQLWSTTTEGNPMTPVFATLEELCEYCEQEKVSVFGYKTATKQEWLNMLGDGLVCHKEGNFVFL